MVARSMVLSQAWVDDAYVGEDKEGDLSQVVVWWVLPPLFGDYLYVGVLIEFERVADGGPFNLPLES